MNQKEINELRRRFRPEKSAISRVYGCYVNSSKEIVSDLDESLGMMPQEESEKYLSLLKKGLSGSRKAPSAWAPIAACRAPVVRAISKNFSASWRLAPATAKT